MRILISNDDGVFAEGIAALAESLQSVGEVFVVAPDRQRSAAGHGITLHKPLYVEQVKIGSGIRAHAVSGTPADCVKFGIIEVMKDAPPDIVVSGINAGSNLGTDVLYSGTVSAAIEGAVQGFTAIAVSQCGLAPYNYQSAAAFMPKLVEQVAREGLETETILNVNVPPLGAGQSIQGVRITTLGTRRYHNEYEERMTPRGTPYFWLSGGLKDLPNAPDCDIVAVKEKYISVSPLHFDLTSRAQIQRLKCWTLD